MRYYSLVKLRGATGQSLFAFDFPYLKREDVRVFVDGTAVSFTFTSPNTIELTTPLTKASDVVIRRFTETGRRLVDYNSVAELTEEVLDMDSLQAFYIVQEALDTAASAVVADIQGNWDAKRGRIINVADPVDDTDAMNRRTFFELNGAYTSKMEEWLRQARVAVNDAVEEANRARDEANRAADIQELTQAIHDGTAEIKVEAERLLTLTVEERIKAEAAVVASKGWADKSAYWYDVFRSIYLGLRSEHPGGEVFNGAVYFNTTDNRLYFYTGTQWYSPTTDADRAEAARRFVESMRNEVSNMRDQTQVYSQQAQDFVTDARDAANAAGMSAGTARNEAAAASNHAQAAEISAGVANERASAADGSAKRADAAAGRAEAAAAQVGETFGDRGGWYVAHGMPTKPMRSALWTVMDGGELNGVEWNAGDMLVYSIKTNSFGRITGTSITPSEPSPIEAEEGLILGDGKFIRARVAANIRWIAHANSEGVKLGDNAVELHLLGNNMVFGALKHPVFHKGNLPTWDDVTGKPSSFPVVAHSHKWDEITGKPAAALRWPTWFEVTDKPTYFPPVSHTHSWNEIANKPDTALRWPTLTEVGAAPEGHGLGTYGTTSRDANSFGMASGFYAAGGAGSTNFYDSFAPLIQSARSGGSDGTGFLGQIQLVNGKLVVRTRASNVWTPWNVLYGSANKPTAADVKARPDDWVPSWSEITGKPSDYPSATHSHSWESITGKPATFPPAAHSHTASEVGAVPMLSLGGGGDHVRFVVLLHKLDNSNIGANYEFAGSLYFFRSNGLYASNRVFITSGKRYNTDKPNVHMFGTGSSRMFVLATCTYKGVKYLAADFRFNAASGAVVVEGRWTDQPIRVDYQNTLEGSAAILNAEVKNSLVDLPLDEIGAFRSDGAIYERDNRVYSPANKPTAADVGARPDNWVPAWGDVTGKPATFPAATHSHSWSELTGVPVYAQRWPTAAEVGAAPSGYGLGTYAVSVPGASVNTGLRNTSGFFNGSSLTDRPSWPVAHVHTWDYYINIAHANAAGYNGVIAMDFNGQGLAYKAISGGIDKGWNYVYSTSNKPTPGEIGAADLNHGHARQFGSEQTLTTEDLDTIKTPGVYAQHANANTSAARHYPELLAGSLIVTVGAGVQQRYHVYNTSRIWTRAQYDQGAWTPWALEYNTANKPSSADVGLSNVPNTVHTTAPTANTVAVRDSAGDLTARLMRSNYQNESAIPAGSQLVFRIDTSNNYLRFCSNPAAVREWLDAGPTRYTGVTVVLASLALVGGASGTLSQDVRGHEGRVSIQQNGYTQSIYFRWPVSDETFQIQIGNDHAIFTLTNSGRTLIRRAGWSENSPWTNWCILTG